MLIKLKVKMALKKFIQALYAA